MKDATAPRWVAGLRELVDRYVRDEYDEDGELLFLDEVGASSLDEAVQMLIEGTLPEEHMDKLTSMCLTAAGNYYARHEEVMRDE